MVRAAAAVILMISATAMLSGCGTCVNLLSDANEETEYLRGKRVYGGVATDWTFALICCTGTDLLTMPFTIPCAAYLVAVDIPLSFIGDTLTLPITRRAT